MITSIILYLNVILTLKCFIYFVRASVTYIKTLCYVTVYNICCELALNEQLRSIWSKPSFLYAIRSVYSALSGSTLSDTDDTTITNLAVKQDHQLQRHWICCERQPHLATEHLVLLGCVYGTAYPSPFILGLPKLTINLPINR